ncbi:MAG: GTP-binding protein [Clostridiaceae bacterium]
MSTKIDIISGFLGSGKTTLIKKLITENLKGEKAAIIENEFGEIAIDGSILRETSMNIKEIKSGCICCSLVGDFKKAIIDILNTYSPDRIIIEPSGVAKLSDVIKSCRNLEKEYDIKINAVITIVDALNAEMYLNNFGEFYKDQIEHANTIIISKAQQHIDDKILSLIRKINSNSEIISSPWEKTSFEEIIKNPGKESYTEFESEIIKEEHHHHKADQVFDTWGLESDKIFSQVKIDDFFENVNNADEYGLILRAKGLLKVEEGKWLEINYTPGEFRKKITNPQKCSLLCFIGRELNKSKLEKLF